MNARPAVLLAVLFVLAGVTFASPAQARGGDGGETEVFNDVYVPPNQTIDGDVNVVFGDA